VLGLFLGAGGCSRQGAARDPAEHGFGGDQGAAAEVVFLTPEVERGLNTLGRERGGVEYGRRDALLGSRPDGPLLASAEWPEAARASLERPWYVYVRDDARRFTFFLPERGRGRERGGWYSGGLAPFSDP
jgi:hypothetical protein